jgi:CubicO group peptidase (beta-lactamase class C family)
MKILAILATVLWALASPSAHAGEIDPRVATDIEAFIRRTMAEVGAVPGLSIAVVENDRIVMTAGYGVADVRSGERVDADTYFYIASSTKSFTALSLAARAARGELDLEAPLGLTYPGSGLPADIAASVSLVDLLSHRSGLENDPITFRAAYSGEAAAEVMKPLLAGTRRSAETAHGVFEYSNLGYNLATTLMDEDWRHMVQDEVLAPAGLLHTTPFISGAAQSGVVAVGHFGDDPQGARVSPVQKVDATMHSAGGLVSTANDMARWLELQLNDGRIDGVQVFPAGLIASTHRALVSQDRDFGAYHRDGYGLGWNLGRYRGERLIHHFGNFSGSRAHVSFMPDRHIGVVVMVNEDLVAGEMADVVANYVYDRLLGRADLAEAAEADIATLIASRDQRREALAKMKSERAARPWLLSRPLGGLAGDYDSPELGTLHVRETAEGLELRLGLLTAVPEPSTEPDTLRVEFVPFQGRAIAVGDAGHLTFDGVRFTRR